MLDRVVAGHQSAMASERIRLQALRGMAEGESVPSCSEQVIVQGPDYSVLEVLGRLVAEVPEEFCSPVTLQHLLVNVAWPTAFVFQAYVALLKANDEKMKNGSGGGLMGGASPGLHAAEGSEDEAVFPREEFYRFLLNVHTNCGRRLLYQVKDSDASPGLSLAAVREILAGLLQLVREILAFERDYTWLQKMYSLATEIVESVLRHHEIVVEKNAPASAMAVRYVDPEQAAWLRAQPVFEELFELAATSVLDDGTRDPMWAKVRLFRIFFRDLPQGLWPAVGQWLAARYVGIANPETVVENFSRAALRDAQWATPVLSYIAQRRRNFCASCVSKGESRQNKSANERDPTEGGGASGSPPNYRSASESASPMHVARSPIAGGAVTSPTASLGSSSGGGNAAAAGARACRGCGTALFVTGPNHLPPPRTDEDEERASRSSRFLFAVKGFLLDKDRHT
ncbi:unnamed protein product [Amoebophrya sp. A25]|nr:unnamed protein product [Amoebophrya sp. A25]|eukprot:GSA25T00007531001.1